MSTRSIFLATLVASALVAGCDRPKSVEPVAATVAAPATAPPVHARAEPIGWRTGDVDVAFAEAKAANKPVFLYWGAQWCPPCNQLKATLFNERRFIERAQHFVAVYVDGDTPTAQKLGTRFSVSGYPTMVLFRPDGTEITRLPGEADPERYLQILALGMNSARPVRATLAAALGDGKGLVADDWQMLAWYSFDTDDQQLVPKGEVPSTLANLAARCPPEYAEAHARLALKAAASIDAKAPRPAAAPARKATLAEIERVLSSPAASRANFDLLANAMPDIVRATTTRGSPERRKLVSDADRALDLLVADATLSNTDRISALDSRVVLLTVDNPEASDGKPAPPSLSDALKTQIVAEVARVDRESTNPYERQTVINAAAALLSDAGMLDASDTLLQAELKKSHSPYYFMLDLAANAKKRGDKAAAIDWTAKAYDGAKGPATRLQWGTVYVNTLVRPRTDGRGADREGRDQGASRDRTRGRELRRPQPSTPDRHGDEARRMERGRRARGACGPHRDGGACAMRGVDARCGRAHAMRGPAEDREHVGPLVELRPTIRAHARVVSMRRTTDRFRQGASHPPPSERISATVVVARLPRSWTACRWTESSSRCASIDSR